MAASGSLGVPRAAAWTQQGGCVGALPSPCYHHHIAMIKHYHVVNIIIITLLSYGPYKHSIIVMVIIVISVCTTSYEYD